MAAMRGPRLQVGSAAWIGEERSSAVQVVQSEVEEFSYSARNELDWLNEHMAGIFDENEINIAETFKTPGKLRGKTPRTIRKTDPAEARVPLSDIFAATPNRLKNHASAQLNRFKSPQLNHASRTSPFGTKPISPRHMFSPKLIAPAQATQDSGYYGSQDINVMDGNKEAQPEEFSNPYDHIVLPTTATSPPRQALSQTANLESSEKDLQTASEDQMTRVLADATFSAATREQQDETIKVSNVEENRSESPGTFLIHQTASPSKSPVPAVHPDENSDDIRSPSEGSSPIGPVVRKSSLNFASLPAREPLAAGKSIGGRLSRTSHVDNVNNMTSYYQRSTGEKSLGNLVTRDSIYEENPNAMDVEEDNSTRETPDGKSSLLSHTKTYTQRLQDQISMLGKSQGTTGGQIKSTSSISTAPQNITLTQPAATPTASPRKDPLPTTPGAFPEDDDDDWIEPPNAAEEAMELRPALVKSHTADVMEDIHSKETIGQPDFAIPKHRKNVDLLSPVREPANHTLGSTPGGHGKSISVSTVPTSSSLFSEEAFPPAKPVFVSNSGLISVAEANMPDTPSKSPSRTFRDSPLKQVKNKLSSILKSSRSLLASSAAISAEGKSLLSPSSTRLGLHFGPSSESIVSKLQLAPQDIKAQTSEETTSPMKPIARRTRASVEREKEEKRREKETKHMMEQMEKLDKAREKEREKARVFSKEQDKTATMEKEMASKKPDERPAAKETPNLTRTNPRKAKISEEVEMKQVDREIEMTDVPLSMPPPSSRSGPSQATRNKDTKRPVKPTKEINTKMKQAPTVIRVNTSSQNSQYHPAGNRASTASHDVPGSSNSQACKTSLQTKPSAQNLRSLASGGRSKALEIAAKKKEQEERESQRRREAKVETEKKRIAAQEEHRKQVERQRQMERDQAEEKKNTQRQATIEKAKQTRAPPPALRSQPNGPPDTTLHQQSQPARPPSRIATGIRDDLSRPVNAILSNASKSGAKRALGLETGDEGQSRRPPSRGGPAYQAKDAKRRRTSENFADELDTGNPPNIKGPPVRPSGGFKKDLPAKSVFQSGYANAPHSATRDLFKATVTAQHNSHVKASHPLDMAQISKGPIPFAPNPNGSIFKTPARPGQFNGAKSTMRTGTRSSPRFQNGDLIELPEIQTDDEDEDDEDQAVNVAAWADSPDLRRALMRQETMDPSQIFGPPAPLNMEEVFNKSKDKWHKFRQRTSSANWSGLDRLTDDDIRKDTAARDKMRRDGGWSYDMSREML